MQGTLLLELHLQPGLLILFKVKDWSLNIYTFLIHCF
jgi:hypothetical protein